MAQQINWTEINKTEHVQLHYSAEKLGFEIRDITEGNFPDYDAIVYHPKYGELTLETKTDFGPHKTGNIVVEIMNTRTMKPSGIDGTKAQLWLNNYYDHDKKEWRIFLSLTTAFREWLKKEIENELVYTTRNFRSDNNAAIVLIPWARLKKFVNLKNVITCLAPAPDTYKRIYDEMYSD